MARIDHYEFGRIVVDRRQETMYLIILAGRVRNWWRQDDHALVLDNLVEILDGLRSHLVVVSAPTTECGLAFVERTTACGSSSRHLNDEWVTCQTLA
jgi:hypothetical protein